MTHIEDLLKDANRIKTRRLDNGITMTTLSISVQDKEKVKFLSLRDDIISHFVQRTDDRCFDHPCVKFIAAALDPRKWTAEH